MSRRFLLSGVLVVALLLLIAANSYLAQGRGAPPGYTPAQQPQGRGGNTPAAQPSTGAVPQANGPLSMILGPTDNVKPFVRVAPKAPTTDTYYLDRPIEEWPPDEFVSNPDREFDWHNLKGWHFQANPLKMTILGKRRVKAGETIEFEGELQDLSGTQTGMSMSYMGPFGRRQSLNVQLRAVAPGSTIFRGTMRIPDYVEPGIYFPISIGANNELRHAKSFSAEDHPSTKGASLEIEVLPNINADVMPPEVQWVKVNTLDAPEGQIRTQRVQDPVSIYAKITDNKSGVAGAGIRLLGPTATCAQVTAYQGKGPRCKFIEASLARVMGQPDVWGAMVSIPQWWEGGEYRLVSMWSEDKAGQRMMMMQSSEPVMKNANINLTQDPANIDQTPPTLFSVWVDKTTARLGEPVTVYAIVADDKAGVGTVAISFAPTPSFIDRVRVHLKPMPKADVIQKSGLDINANMWSGNVDTIPWFEPGEWKVDRITIRDNADNYLDLLPEYHPEVDVKLTYTGGVNLREQLNNYRKGGAVVAPRGGGDMATGVPAAPAASAAAPATTGNVVSNDKVTLPNGRSVDVLPGAVPDPVTGRIRRVDMIPPHPPRGSCLNCHEP